MVHKIQRFMIFPKRFSLPAQESFSNFYKTGLSLGENFRLRESPSKVIKETVIVAITLPLLCVSLYDGMGLEMKIVVLLN
jgi:hypothetical protein